MTNRVSGSLPSRSSSPEGRPLSCPSPERLTPSNPEHVALARRVQNQLEERGLLRLVIQPRPAPT